MKKSVILMLALSLGLVTFNSCKKEGCTDPDATNYNKKAKKDDGSCTYDPNVVSYEISENITVPTTIEGKTVKITSDITISSDVTVMPGAVIIMAAGASIEVGTSGSFNCTGTAEKPIIIRGETQTSGFWEGIAFKSNNPNNKLIYTTVKDAGTYWGWEYSNVFVGDNARLEITNSTISNSDNTGLYFLSTANIPNFSNNTFSNNTNVGLSIPAKLIGKIDSGSNYNSGNGIDFIHVRGGAGSNEHLTQETTWPATTTPCLVLDELRVNGGLILSAGVNLVMEAGSSINVTSTGFLTSNGTASNKVIIKGKSASAGYWDGIRISSNNTSNKISNTNISDGGSYWGYEYANIHITGRLEIDNSNVSNANSWGIYVTGSASIYSNGTVQTTPAGVTANNNLTGNGMGSSASCTDGCTVYFE